MFILLRPDRVNTPSGVNVSMSWLGENVRPIDLRSMELPLY